MKPLSCGILQQVSASKLRADRLYEGMHSGRSGLTVAAATTLKALGAVKPKSRHRVLHAPLASVLQDRLRGLCGLIHFG